MALYPSDYIQSLEDETKRRLTENYSDLQRSECMETLAIAQFFGGKNAQAIVNFDSALNLRKSYDMYSRSIPRIGILAGIASYRLGDLHKAEKYFDMCLSQKSKLLDSDLYCTACSNKAIVILYSRCYAHGGSSSIFNNKLDTITGQPIPHNIGAVGPHLMSARSFALEAVTLCFEKNSRELNVSEHLRVLLLIYIKSNCIKDAIDLLGKYRFQFNYKEYNLLLGGCYSALGDYRTALALIQKCDFNCDGTLLKGRLDDEERHNKEHLAVKQGNSDRFKCPVHLQSCALAMATNVITPYNPANSLQSPSEKGAQVAPVKQGRRRGKRTTAIVVGDAKDGNVAQVPVRPYHLHIGNRGELQEIVLEKAAVRKFEAKSEDNLLETMVNFNISNIEQYIFSVERASNAKLTVQKDDYWSHFVSALETLRNITEAVRNERNRDRFTGFMMPSVKSHLEEDETDFFSTFDCDFLAEAEGTSSLLACASPDSAIGLTVALSMLAMATSELNISNLLMVDGLHVQFCEIMHTLSNVLTTPMDKRIKDHVRNTRQSMVNKHVNSVDPNIEHFNVYAWTTTDPELHSSQYEIQMSNKLISDSAITNYVHVHRNRGEENPLMPYTLNVESSVDSVATGSVVSIITKKAMIDAIITSVDLLNFSVSLLIDMMEFENTGEVVSLQGSMSMSASVDKLSKLASSLGSTKRSAPSTRSGCPSRCYFDTVIAENMVDSFKTLVSILSGNGQESISRIASSLRKRFGCTVPINSNDRNKISVLPEAKGNKLTEETHVSAVRSEVLTLPNLVDSAVAATRISAVKLPPRKEEDFDFIHRYGGTGMGSALHHNNSSVEIDEFVLWLEWALLLIDVPGYGFMTLSFHQEKLNVDTACEVYHYLLRAYANLNSVSNISAASSAILAGRLANHDIMNFGGGDHVVLRLVFLSALIKLRAMVETSNLVTNRPAPTIATIEMHMEDFSKLAVALNNPYYVALSFRYQLDWLNHLHLRKDPPPPPHYQGEEHRQWAELHMEHLHKVELNLMRNYVIFASRTEDLYLQKDAYKKMINFYMDVNCTTKKYHLRTSDKAEEDVELRSLGNLKHKPTKSRVIPVEEEIGKLSEKEIERKESESRAWMMKISGVRAKTFLKKMRDLSLKT